jgi:hypothetical protein
MPGVRRVKGTINRKGKKILFFLKAVLEIIIASTIANIENKKRSIIRKSNCLSISKNFDAMNVNTL